MRENYACLQKHVGTAQIQKGSAHYVYSLPSIEKADILSPETIS
jgi:hypothetical protein